LANRKEFEQKDSKEDSSGTNRELVALLCPKSGFKIGSQLKIRKHNQPAQSNKRDRPPRRPPRRGQRRPQAFTKKQTPTTHEEDGARALGDD
jgi:hypothetical protein